MEVSRKKEVIIDLDKVESSNDLQELLKVKLEFPDFYGKNWNAFWDTITGLVELPESIIFKNWGVLEDVLPEEAKMLKAKLFQLNEKYPSLGCKYDFE